MQRIPQSLRLQGQGSSLNRAPSSGSAKLRQIGNKRSLQTVRANLLDRIFKQKEDSTASSNEGVDPSVPGFRFDGAMQRWVRDDRMKGKQASAGVVVTPMSGSPYTVWPVMHSYLVSKGLKSIDIDTALSLMKKGAILVDVRLAKDYNAQHAEGAVNVPMFRITAGDETMDKVKRFVMASLAMDATERDPDFTKNMEKAVGGKRKKIIVMCSTGGTLETVVTVESTGKRNENDPDKAFGRETRSLKACYELYKAGFSDVLHLKGGLSEWRYNKYPLE